LKVTDWPRSWEGAGRGRLADDLKVTDWPTTGTGRRREGEEGGGCRRLAVSLKGATGWVQAWLYRWQDGPGLTAVTSHDLIKHGPMTSAILLCLARNFSPYIRITSSKAHIIFTRKYVRAMQWELVLCLLRTSMARRFYFNDHIMYLYSLCNRTLYYLVACYPNCTVIDCENTQ
jgi:hypothetical protein